MDADTSGIIAKGKIIRVWTYKLRPNKAQGKALDAVLETQRRLYNRAVLYRAAYWDLFKERVPFGDMKKRLITDAVAIAKKSATQSGKKGATQSGPAAPGGLDLAGYLRQWKSWQGALYLAGLRETSGDRPDLPTREEADALKPEFELSREDVDAYFAADIRASAPHLAQCPRRVSAATIDRLEAGTKTYFSLLKIASTLKGVPHPPWLKGRKDYHTISFDSFDGSRVDGNRVWLTRLSGDVGGFKYHQYRTLPEDADIRCCSLTKDAKGAWFIRLTLALPFAPPEPSANPAASIEYSADGACLEIVDDTERSESLDISLPWHKAAERLAALERELARRRGGANRKPGAKASRRWRATVAKIKGASARVANARKAGHLHLAKSLTGRYGSIAIKGVDTARTVKRPAAKPDAESDGFLPNGRERQKERARKTLDAGWAGLTHAIEAAAETRGVTVEKVKKVEPER